MGLCRGPPERRQEFIILVVNFSLKKMTKMGFGLVHHNCCKTCSDVLQYLQISTCQVVLLFQCVHSYSKGQIRLTITKFVLCKNVHRS